MCALVRYYTAYGGNLLPTFRHNLSVQSYWIHKEETDRLFQKVGKKLGQYVASYLRREQMSNILRHKPENFVTP
jgi:hypothetical protein